MSFSLDAPQRAQIEQRRQHTRDNRLAMRLALQRGSCVLALFPTQESAEKGMIPARVSQSRQPCERKFIFITSPYSDASCSIDLKYPRCNARRK